MKSSRFFLNVFLLLCLIFGISSTTYGASLFFDDFNDGNYADKWVLSLQQGSSTITESGTDLHILIQQPLSSCTGMSVDTIQRFSGINLVIEGRFKPVGKGAIYLHLKKDDNNLVQFGLNSDDAPYLEFQSVQNGVLTVDHHIENSTPYFGSYNTYRIDKTGDQYEVFVNGVKKGSTYSNSGIGNDNLVVELANHTCSYKSGPTDNYYDYISVDNDLSYGKIVSDSTWKASVSAPAGWTDASFDDSGWGNAVIQTYAWGDPAQFIPETTGKYIWEGQNVYWNSSNSYLRKTFVLNELPTIATLSIFADNGFEVYVNGILIGMDTSQAWDYSESYDVTDKLVNGQNVIAIHGINYEGPAGVLAELKMQGGLILPPTLTSGLVAYYPFNGNANDESGNSNNGTVYGATLTADRFGNANSAYYFNGTSSYIDLGSMDINTKLDFTIQAWFKRNAKKNGMIIGQYKHLYPSETSFGLNLNADNPSNPLLLTNLTIGNTGYSASCSFDDSTSWHQAISIYNAAEKKLSLFLDSNVAGSVTIDNPNDVSTHFLVGSVFNAVDAFYFDGKIDDIRIYNRSLSAAEVQALYSVDMDNIDSDGDGTPDSNDGCPNDPNKTEPGVCGCGIPETALRTYYRDLDNDGFGNPSVSVQACTQPSGYVLNNSDCNDSDLNINPNATEICGNNIDDNCNGQIDEGCVGSSFFDHFDNNDYNHNWVVVTNQGGGSVTESATDLRVYTPHPAPDTCAGKWVRTKNTFHSNYLSAEMKFKTLYYGGVVGIDIYQDNDHYVRLTINSNDAPYLEYGTPFATRIEGSGPYYNADVVFKLVKSGTTYDVYVNGTKKATFSYSGITNSSVFVQIETADCSWKSSDNDTYIDYVRVEGGSTGEIDECPNDPNKTEPGICGCGIPETALKTYYGDSDNDGFGNPSLSIQACTQPAGYVLNNSDCKDSNLSINPSVTEICGDGVDNNCDGQIDEGCSTSSSGLITFTSNRDGNNEIYIMDDCVGCAERRLTQNPANDDWPAISPDGRTIAFFSNRDGSWRIYTMPVNNPSSVQPLSPPLPTSGVARIDWHPSGNWLIFMVYESSYWSVWRINADGSEFARLIDGSSQDIAGPHFTKDGNHIVFSKNGHFNAWSGEIYIINADGQTGERQITNSPDGHNGASLWPEEVFVNGISNVVFSRGVGGVGQHFFIQPTSGTGPATDISAVSNPSVSIWEWGPVSAKVGEIVFNTNRSGSTNIWKMNADGTNAVQMTTGSGWSPDWWVPNPVPTNGLVAYYPFNGNANDESGNGNHGTVYGATLTTDRLGNVNSAYRFSGNSSTYIRVPRSSSLEPQNALSISFWMLRRANGSFSETVIRKTANCGPGYLVWGPETSFTAKIDGINACRGEASYINVDISPYLNEWAFYTFVYDTTNGGEFYINGIQKASSAPLSPTIYHSGDLFIGGSTVHGLDGGIDGVLDDIHIYNRALSASEIQALYSVDVDSDGDGTPDYIDGCPNDPNKIAPSICGCGVPDTDTDSDGTPDCNDLCPNDPGKVTPGVCGCGIPDTDSDGDGTANCIDQCPNDVGKIMPGICGCGVADTDSDVDGIADCIDNCPSKFNPDQRNVDGDLNGDVCDICPSDATDMCNPNRSIGASIGPVGGSISTPDGSITIIIPQGALNSDTSMSITETGTSFELATNLGNGTALFGVNIQPEGQVFNIPITIIFRWQDVDNDGKIDDTHIVEDNLLITKNNVAVTDRCKFDVGCDVLNNSFTFNVSSLSEFALLILNGAPVVQEIIAPIDPVHIGTAITAEAHFSDPGFLDSHTATWDWGDGTTSVGTVTESGGSGTVQDTHIYTQAGVYGITLTVTDKNGDSGTAVFQYVVVYDPEGGFVTGGGWINSPAGAYVPNPSLTGKATFGFVSKYKKGANVPTGNTEFQFKVANLNFHSELYQWLVVAGAKAQYKGTGTINGNGNYGFMLTAIDGDLKGTTDKFRIKIWDKNNSDTIVYDNQLAAPDDADPTTVIGGGSIVIHKQ